MRQSEKVLTPRAEFSDRAVVSCPCLAWRRRWPSEDLDRPAQLFSPTPPPQPLSPPGLVTADSPTGAVRLLRMKEKTPLLDARAPPSVVQIPPVLLLLLLLLPTLRDDGRCPPEDAFS